MKVQSVSDPSGDETEVMGRAEQLTKTVLRAVDNSNLKMFVRMGMGMHLTIELSHARVARWLQ